MRARKPTFRPQVDLLEDRTVPSAGTLDPTFGTGGRVTTDFGAERDIPQAVALQSDGKIVVVGDSEQPGTGRDFAVARYNPDGTLDATFGTGGRVTIDFGIWTQFGPGNEGMGGVAIQPDGKLVLSGFSEARTGEFSATTRFAVARLTASGQLDTTFGTGGRVTFGFGPIQSDVGDSVTVQPDGKIVVVGSSIQPGTGVDLAVARLTSSGALDPTFGTGGRVTVDFSSTDGLGLPDYGLGVALQPDGRIVVNGGTRTLDTGHDFAVVRLTSSGALDPTFGTGGKVTVDIGSLNDHGSGVAVQSDGAIILAGEGSPNNTDGTTDFAAARLTAGGVLDTSFGWGGKVTIEFGGQDSAGGMNMMALQPDGSIVLAGTTQQNTGVFFAAARLTLSGALDATFGTGGRVTLDIGPDTDWGSGVAVQPDGGIVVVGTSDQWQAGTGQDFAVARIHGGAPVAPTAAVAGPTAAVTGQTLTFTLKAADPEPDDHAAEFTFGIDWDGDGTPDQTVTGLSGATVTRQFSSVGTAGFRVRATDKDGLTGGWASHPVTVSAMTPAALQDQFNAGGVVQVEATASDAVTDLVAAVNDLPDNPPQPVEVVVDLGGGTFTGQTIATQPNVTVTFVNGTFNGASPALIVESGTVFVTDFTLTNTTDAPTLLVLGGQVVVRNTTIRESPNYSQAAVEVRGGEVDLGTEDDPGGNVLKVVGAGEWVRNTGSYPVSDVGNSMVVNRAPLVAMAPAGQAPKFPGWLDAGFGGDGLVTADLGADDTVSALAVQPDGKVLVGGHTWDGGALWRGFVMRFHPDGTPDLTFGTNGVVFSPVLDEEEYYELAVRPDGHIVAQAWTAAGMVIRVFNPDGSPDLSFGTGGRVLTEFAGYSERFMLQADGRILTPFEVDEAYAFVRFNADGSPDDGTGLDSTPADTFGTAGRVVTEFRRDLLDHESNQVVFGLVLRPDGGFTVGGLEAGPWTTIPADFEVQGSAYNLVLVRYDANGSVIPDGRTTTFLTYGFERLPQLYEGNLALLPDGRYMLAADIPDGYPFETGAIDNTKSIIARLLPEGTPDPTFGPEHDGFLRFDESQHAGATFASSGEFLLDYIATTRYTPEGLLDVGFGPEGDGRPEWHPDVAFYGDPYMSQIYDRVLILPDGDVLRSGYTRPGANPDDYPYYDTWPDYPDHPKDLAVVRVAGGPVPVALAAGEPAELTAAARDLDPDDAPDGGFPFDWTVTRDGDPYTSGSGATFAFTPELGGTYTITVSTRDREGSIATSTQTVTVAPLTTSELQERIASGGTAELRASTQEAVDVLVAAVNGLSAPPSPVAIVVDLGGGTFTGQVIAAPPDVTVTFENGTFIGGSPAITVTSGTVIIRNSTLANTTDAPTLLVAGGHVVVRNTTIGESTSFARAAVEVTGGTVDLGTAADPGGNTLSVNGSGVWIRSTLPNAVSADGNTFFVDGAALAAPRVGPITAPTDPLPKGTAVSARADYTGTGAAATDTAVWNWGDGATSAGTPTGSYGFGSFSGTHTYAAAGVYTVTLTVADSAGTSAQVFFQYVVVYDAAAGFVTGGGWITSPAGAFAANPSLTGKANFGFVSRYQNGASVPTGQTEFQFKAGDFIFKSTSYDWMVIAGARAKYKGSGTVNGSGNYGFMITAIDGQVNGGGGVDRFRIKIWDKATGLVVYDNQMGASENEDPITALGGGSIVIHK